MNLDFTNKTACCDFVPRFHILSSKVPVRCIYENMYVCTVKLHSTYISQLSNLLKHSKIYLIGQNGSNQNKSVLKIYKTKCHELNEMAKKALSSPNMRSSSEIPVVRNGTKTTFHCQFNSYSGKNHWSLSVFCFARENSGNCCNNLQVLEMVVIISLDCAVIKQTETLKMI